MPRPHDHRTARAGQRRVGWSRTLLGAVFLWAALVALTLPRNPWFEWPTGRVRLAFTLFVILLLALGPAVGRLGARAVVARPLWSVGCGTLAGGLVVAAHAPLATIDFGWDAKNVFVAATRLLEGAPRTPGMTDYFARYPNNLPITTLEALVMWLGSHVGVPALGAVVAAQVGGVVVVLWCLGESLSRLGHPGAVWPVQGLAALYLGLTPHLAIPYSDLPAATFVALTLWSAVRARTGSGPGWWLAALFFLVCAVTLKPYTVAVAIGALAFVPGLAARRGWMTALLSVVVATAVLAGGVMTLHAAAGRVTGYPPEVRAHAQPAFPPLHFLTLGTYDTHDPSPTRVYGGWDGPYAKETREVTDPDARRAMLIDRLTSQLGDQGVGGTLGFLVTKTAWFWGDGTFWAHGEAADRDSPGLLGERWSGVQEWFIGSGAPYRQVTAPLLQGLWILVLLVAAIGLWRARPQVWVTQGAITLFVLTGYLMLFEGRARYVIALLPVLLLVVGLSGGSALRPRREAERASVDG